MDQFFAKLFLLEDSAIIAIFFAIAITGGVVGAFLFEVRVAFRRVTYFWWFACLNLFFIMAQLIWLAAPAAAEAGFLSALVIAGLATFFLFGLALYYGSAARSNHIDATTSNAWLGFVPFANLWLMLKAGDPALRVGPERSTFARYVVDPVLVVLAILVLATANVAADAKTKMLESRTADATALQNLVSQGQTVSELFALEAAASSKDLPVRIDELTILSRVEARGDTLWMRFEVERENATFKPEFKSMLADQQCAPDMFASAVARGGKLALAYYGPDGSLIDEFVIAREDCGL